VHPRRHQSQGDQRITMDYLEVAEASHLPGLRLALTAGVPGPWSESAKALFRHHQVPFHAVRQVGGGDNPDLVTWTGHRNAPVAVYEDEAPRVRWLELLDLAERLGKGASLYPQLRADRIEMVGLVNEIAGEHGLAWNARLFMLDASYQAQGEKAYRNPMLKDYGYAPEAVAAAKQEVADLLGWLADRMQQRGSHYLVADQFTAADIYWAYFSNLVQPQAHEVNPMPDFLRKSYSLAAQLLGEPDPILIEARDWVFEHHLELPLDF